MRDTLTFRIVRTLRVAGLMEPISHFSDAMVAGTTLYVSGVVATDERGDIVGGGDVVEQTRQIFRNLRRILEPARPTSPSSRSSCATSRSVL